MSRPADGHTPVMKGPYRQQGEPPREEQLATRRERREAHEARGGVDRVGRQERVS